MHTVDTPVAVTHTKPHSLSIFLKNPHDLGNQTVNPLLTASVARQGRLHLDERRDAGRLYRPGRPRRAALSASQTLSYSMPVEHWFSTLLAHMIPPFLRGKLPGMKKRTPCDRLVHCAAEFRLQEGEEGGAQWGVCMFEWQRERLAGKTRPEEQQLVNKQYISVQALVYFL